MTDIDLQAFAYVLAVRDLKGSTAYFRDVLGFTAEWQDEDRWQALRRGGRPRASRELSGRAPPCKPRRPQLLRHGHDQGR